MGTQERLRASALVFSALGAALLLGSCSLNQQVSLAADGSGTAVIQVALAPMLVSYFQDLDASLGGISANQAIFDVAQVKKSFQDVGGLSQVTAATPTANTLNVSFSFSDVNRIFDSAAQRGMIRPLSFSIDNGTKTLRFHLGRDNYSALKDLPPLADNPVLLSLSPQGATLYSEKQYLDILDYAFSDYAQGQPVAGVVKSSFVNVTVKVNGQIISQSGGVQQGNDVRFTVPLIKALTLETPLDYAITFR